MEHFVETLLRTAFDWVQESPMKIEIAHRSVVQNAIFTFTTPQEVIVIPDTSLFPRLWTKHPL